jgi:hypothetical protein
MRTARSPLVVLVALLICGSCADAESGKESPPPLNSTSTDAWPAEEVTVVTAPFPGGGGGGGGFLFLGPPPPPPPRLIQVCVWGALHD